MTYPDRHRLETYTGRMYDYDDPQPDQICLTDIAHALSNTARFAGHTRTFYSVAEHSLLVEKLLPYEATASRANHLYRVGALLHDAHEAYLGDLPTPLKRAMGSAYTEMVTRCDRAIGLAFGITPSAFKSLAVERADATALRLEAWALKSSTGASHEWYPAWERFNLFNPPRHLVPPDFQSREPLTPERAENDFLSAVGYERLAERAARHVYD